MRCALASTVRSNTLEHSLSQSAHHNPPKGALAKALATQKDLESLCAGKVPVMRILPLDAGWTCSQASAALKAEASPDASHNHCEGIVKGKGKCKSKGKPQVSKGKGKSKGKPQVSVDPAIGFAITGDDNNPRMDGPIILVDDNDDVWILSNGDWVQIPPEIVHELDEYAATMNITYEDGL